jgi:ribosomal protein L11 methyltransferase
MLTSVAREWLVLTVRVAEPEAQAEVAEALIELGGSAVAQAGDRLSTYLEAPAAVDDILRATAARLDEVAPGAWDGLEWSWQRDEDWGESWRRGLQPRRVGERLIVTPTWIEPESRPGDLVLVIDPEMAFGTGEHATTRGALRELEAVVRPGDRVLDVGTGSAILAIAAAKLGAGEVMAVESDPDAMENAGDNLRRNEVADRVDLVHGLVDDEFLALLGPARFEVIVANVLSSVLVPLLGAFHESLVPPGAGAGSVAGAGSAAGGHLILGGILDEEADAVIEAAEAAGFTLLREDLEEEWWGGLFRVQPRRRDRAPRGG